MADLQEVLDAVDLSIARSDGVLPPAATDDLARVSRMVRRRSGFVGEVLVVALAGGTGSGKSSILNALLGHPVVTTGIVRPTTQTATAVHAERKHVDLNPLLGALDVDTLIHDDAAGDLVFIDLPDFDSTQEAHRHVVETVLPQVDAVIWVLDPEKYADPVLHAEFLTHLVDHEPRFLFVLNQADRLDGQVDDALGGLRRHLEADGFEDPWLAASVGDDRDGAEVEVGELRLALEQRLDAKSTALSKIATDVRRLAGDGWRACIDIDVRDLGDQSRDAVALAAATFVSLGVAAYALHHRMAGR